MLASVASAVGIAKGKVISRFPPNERTVSNGVRNEELLRSRINAIRHFTVGNDGNVATCNTVELRGNYGSWLRNYSNVPFPRVVFP